MRGDRFTRMLSMIALSVAVLALVVSGWVFLEQRGHAQQVEDHAQQVEALGELIRQSIGTGRPIMDMGPPGGGRPKLDRGD